ncbi:MAG TPA: DUF881 domain-containing protein [Mycobacteriales bacterium]
MSVRPQRNDVWRVLVPVVCLAAGMLFAASAETALGTDLRAGRRVELTQLIAEEEQRVARFTGQATTLQHQVDELESQAARGDQRVGTEQDRAEGLAAPAGLTPARGPALSVTLDDAPRGPDGALPPGARNVDDVVVHQQDVQAVVNALWAGGAEAMTIMGERIITTGAVRCVGNVLLLYGRTYSPPYRITAIGDPDRMRSALDRQPGVVIYQKAAEYFGLGYNVESRRDVTLPGYDGPLRLNYAEAMPE